MNRHYYTNISNIFRIFNYKLNNDFVVDVFVIILFIYEDI